MSSGMCQMKESIESQLKERWLSTALVQYIN